jgi:hypothetical protein
MKGMAYSIRTTYYLNATGAPTNDSYEKQICIKNKIGIHPLHHF